MLEDNLNVLDGTQEPVVEALETGIDIGGDSFDEGERDTTEERSTSEQQKLADPVSTQEQEGEAKPQSREENAKFKEVRQGAEQRAKADMLNQFERSIAGIGLKNPVTGKPIQSYDDLEEYKRVKPIFDEAYSKGISYEEEIKRREKLKKELLENDPEYQSVLAERDRLRKEHNEKQLSDDLKEIKKAYPEEQAKHIKELGEEFIALCASGVSPKIAYEVIRRAQPKAPPSMGDIKAMGVKEETNRYATMSDSDFEKAITKAKYGELTKGR